MNLARVFEASRKKKTTTTTTTNTTLKSARYGVIIVPLLIIGIYDGHCPITLL